MDAADNSEPFRFLPAIRQALCTLAASVRQWWSETQFPASARQVEPSPIAVPNARSAFFASPAMGLVTLILFAAPVLLPNLSYPLVEPDENRNAQIALEMFQTGDYIVPTRHGRPYLIKPPLLFWLVSSSYRLLGVNEWAARLPVALCALLTVLSTYLLGRKAVGDRAAWIGALLLLVSAGFVLAGRFLLMDAVLALFTTVALLAAHAGAAGQRRGVAWWLLAGAAAGLGILVKGPVALVLVVPPLAAALWLARESFRMRWRDWVLFVDLALAIAAPWYVAIALRQNDFLGEFLWKHNVQRYTQAFDHQQPWWFYLPVLFLGMLPASLLFPALIVFLLSRNEKVRRLRTPSVGFLVLAAAWVLLFFSFSSSKLPTYILPAIPPICLLLGRVIDCVLLPAAGEATASASGFFQSAKRTTLPRAALAVGLAGIAAATVDVALGGDSHFGYAICGFVATLSLALIAAALRNKLRPGAAGWSLLACASLALMSFLFNDIFAEIAARRSKLIQAAPEVAVARQRAEGEHIPVVFYGALGESASLYMNDQGIVKFAKDDRELLLEYAQSHPRLLLLANSSNAAMVLEDLPATHRMQPQPGMKFLFEVSDTRSTAERSLAQRRRGETR
jgi:4-amino-4-deoxy-L-arabinose transferase-like glycosyltransferase